MCCSVVAVLHVVVPKVGWKAGEAFRMVTSRQWMAYDGFRRTKIVKMNLKYSKRG